MCVLRFRDAKGNAARPVQQVSARGNTRDTEGIQHASPVYRQDFQFPAGGWGEWSTIFRKPRMVCLQKSVAISHRSFDAEVAADATQMLFGVVCSSRLFCSMSKALGVQVFCRLAGCWRDRRCSSGYLPHSLREWEVTFTERPRCRSPVQVCTIPGRALALVRNVGHHMCPDAG